MLTMAIPDVKISQFAYSHYAFNVFARRHQHNALWVCLAKLWGRGATRLYRHHGLACEPE